MSTLDKVLCVVIMKWVKGEQVNKWTAQKSCILLVADVGIRSSTYCNCWFWPTRLILTEQTPSCSCSCWNIRTSCCCGKSSRITHWNDSLFKKNKFALVCYLCCCVLQHFPTSAMGVMGAARPQAPFTGDRWHKSWAVSRDAASQPAACFLYFTVFFFIFTFHPPLLSGRRSNRSAALTKRLEDCLRNNRRGQTEH